MKTSPIATFLAVLTLFLGAASVSAICDIRPDSEPQGKGKKAQKAKDQPIQLATLLCILRESFGRYDSAVVGRYKVQLTSASATVKSATSKSGTAGADFEIVKFGGKLKKSRTQTLTINLKPSAAKLAPAFQPDQIAVQIAEAIKTATTAVAYSEQQQLPPHLELVPDFTYEIALGLSRSGEGGLTLFFVNIGGAYEREDVHILKLNFAIKPATPIP